MIRINRQKFQSAIGRCARVASSKSTLDALQHAAISFDGKTLTYMVTDIQLALRGTLPAEGEPCSFCVNAKELQTILASLEGDEVKLDLTERKLAVSATGRRRFHASTLSHDDFPKVDAPNGTSAVIQSKQLKLALTRVMFGAAPETEARQQLQGIKLHTRDGKLIAATTDGHRAARTVIPYDGELDLLLPAAAARELLPLLDDFETVSLSKSRHGNWISAGTEHIRHQDYGASFPPVDAMLADQALHGFEIDRQALLSSLKALSRVNRDAVVRVTANGSTLTLETKGESKDGHDVLEIDADHPLDAGYTARYLVEALTACEAETVRIAYNAGDLEPLRIQAPEWEAIIMPVRL